MPNIELSTPADCRDALEFTGINDLKTKLSKHLDRFASAEAFHAAAALVRNAANECGGRRWMERDVADAIMSREAAGNAQSNPTQTEDR